MEFAKNVLPHAVKANIEQPKAVEMTVKCVDAAIAALFQGKAAPALFLVGVAVLYATQWVPTNPQIRREFLR